MKKFNFNFFKKPRTILILLTGICVLSIGISAVSQSVAEPFRVVASVFVVPLQRGINQIGAWFSDQRKENLTLDEALSQNEELKKKVAELEAANQKHAGDEAEIKRQSELLELKDTYQSYAYHTTGATVIMKNTGSNWYRKFTIDKGSQDGLAVDMNVIASGGLVGIITDIGPHYAIVTSIIDEESKVSGMLRKTLDTCIVAGDMAAIQNDRIRLEYMNETFNSGVDNIIVTSTISDKYLPGIVIGKAVDIKMDENKLAKSGYLLPAVDFQHLKDVLVITTLKQNMSEEDLKKVEKQMAEIQKPAAPENTTEESSVPEDTSPESKAETAAQE